MCDKNLTFSFDIVDGSLCKAWFQCNTRRWTQLPKGCNNKGNLLLFFL